MLQVWSKDHTESDLGFLYSAHLAAVTKLKKLEQDLLAASEAHQAASDRQTRLSEALSELRAELQREAELDPNPGVH